MDNKYLILVEGKSDVEIIRAVLEHVLPEDINTRVHYYVCNGYCNLLSSIRPFLDHYDQSVKLIAVFDADTDSSERIVEKIDFVKEHVNYDSLKDRLELICFAPSLDTMIAALAHQHSFPALKNDKKGICEFIDNNIECIIESEPFKRLISYLREIPVQDERVTIITERLNNESFENDKELDSKPTIVNRNSIAYLWRSAIAISTWLISIKAKINTIKKG